MTIAYYISHPQVAIDPAVAVPQWRLSAVGRARLAAVQDATWVRSIARMVTSAETKAIETARLLAANSAAHIEIRESMHENDRSATGFLPPPEFERVADRFFAEPDVSVLGWERAVDAQARIVREVDAVLRMHDPALPIGFSGHGGVGTLLFCHLAGEPIRRSRDQPAGGGNVYAFALAGRRLRFAWTALEAVEAALRGHRPA